MLQFVNAPPQYRYERKFVLQDIPHAEVIHRIRMHPALFREIYYPRQINNIYLDTEDLRFFTDNLVGVADRKKVRVRWYGKTFGRVQNPKLEYKIKAGLLGDKHTYSVPDFTVEPPFSDKKFAAHLQHADLPPSVAEELKMLRPTLLNSYRRTYFQTADKKFRLTADEKLTYYRTDRPESHFQAQQIERGRIILELKYSPEHDRAAGKVMNLLPFRLDKSSKYVTGVELFQRF